MPTLRQLCDAEAAVPWQRALEIARALALHRVAGRPAVISDAISIDGDQVHVPVLPEPRTAADAGDVMWPRHLVAYCSPEQMMGKELREPSHVYSIGAITYELLTKRVPFPDAKGPAGLVTAQLKTEPLAPSTHADVPRAVDQLVLRCLRKLPVERFESLDALARAIDELFD